MDMFVPSCYIQKYTYIQKQYDAVELFTAMQCIRLHTGVMAYISCIYETEYVDKYL